MELELGGRLLQQLGELAEQGYAPLEQVEAEVVGQWRGPIACTEREDSIDIIAKLRHLSIASPSAEFAIGVVKGLYYKRKGKALI